MIFYKISDCELRPKDKQHSQTAQEYSVLVMVYKFKLEI